MKNTNLIKFSFILVIVLLLGLTPTIASDQQPVLDAQVTFEVA